MKELEQGSQREKPQHPTGAATPHVHCGHLGTGEISKEQGPTIGWLESWHRPSLQPQAWEETPLQRCGRAGLFLLCSAYHWNHINFWPVSTSPRADWVRVLRTAVSSIPLAWTLLSFSETMRRKGKWVHVAALLTHEDRWEWEWAARNGHLHSPSILEAVTLASALFNFHWSVAKRIRYVKMPRPPGDHSLPGPPWGSVSKQLAALSFSKVVPLQWSLSCKLTKPNEKELMA